MVTQYSLLACAEGVLPVPLSRSPRHFDAISGRLSWLVVVRPDFHVLPPHVASVVAICVLKQHQPMVPQVYPSDVYD